MTESLHGALALTNEIDSCLTLTIDVTSHPDQQLM